MKDRNLESRPIIDEVKFQLSEAYWAGMTDRIVDEYEPVSHSKDDECRHDWRDPVDYWVSHLSLFSDLQWNRERDLDYQSVWGFDEGTTYVNIGEALKGQRSLTKEIKLPGRFEDLKEWYEGRFLTCEGPEGNEEERYHRKCVLKAIGMLDDIIEEWARLTHRRKADRSARKSAVSAVMSRNMSHNVGSHVLANLSNSGDLRDSLPDRVDDEAGWDGPVAEFNDYLRTRMDFIADISTSSPAASTPISIYQDVFFPFVDKGGENDDSGGQPLLLEHISGVEDLGLKNINFNMKVNGDDVSDESVQDLPFASPNGLLGAHALYVIVENIIRNSAKHAYDGSQHDGFDLTIDVKEDEGPPGLIEVSIYDSLGNGGEILKEGTDEEIALTKSLNNNISEDIIEDDGSLNYEGWGVREMKICAAYLRSIAPEDLDQGFEPPLLKASAFERFGSSDTEDLGYTFFLQRPKEVFILDPNESLDVTVSKNDLARDLAREGIAYVADEEEMEAALEEGVEHRVLVVIDPDEKVNEKKVKSNISALPLRVLRPEPENKLFESLKDLLASDRENDTEDTSSASGKTSTDEVDFDGKQLILRVWEAWHSEEGHVDRLLLRTGKREITDDWKGTDFVTIKGNEKDALRKAEGSVIYDRHGEMLLEGLHREDINMRYEAVEGGSPSEHLLKNPPAGDSEREKYERKKLALEIIEAGECGVMLLDERIQGLVESKKKTYGSNEKIFPVNNNYRKKKSILEMMNVWIPEEQKVNLDYPKRFKTNLSNWFDNHIEHTDLLVVHLGILEKLYGDDLVNLFRNTSSDTEEENVLQAFRDDEVDVIVTSGRGRPPKAVKMGVRFLHYSQVAEHIAKERSKYHFCRALLSARKLRHE